MAREKIKLRVKDKADETIIPFPNWAEAHNHIRQVVLGGLVEELVEWVHREPSDARNEAVEELHDIAKEINYPASQQALIMGMQRWKEYVDNGPYTVIELVD